MNGVKDLWQFDLDRGQFVYVKKATVINFLGGDPPERQPVGLRIEQFIQFVKATRVARFAVDLRQRLLNCLLDLWRLGAPTVETSLPLFARIDWTFIVTPSSEPVHARSQATLVHS